MTNNDEQMAALREQLCKALHIFPEELELNLPNNVGTAEMDKLVEIFTTTTAEAVREAQKNSEHYWIKYYGDQRKFLDGSDGDMNQISELNRHQQLHKDRLAMFTNTKDAI